MRTILLNVDATGRITTIVGVQGERGIITHEHKTLESAWHYIFQYTVNAHATRYELIVQDDSWQNGTSA